MSSDQELRSRLEALNRARLEAGVVRPAAPADQPARTGPKRLEEVVPGRVVSAGGGTFYRVTNRLCGLGPQAQGLARQYGQMAKASAGRSGGSGIEGLHANWAEEAVFLDLETCGFAGSPVFLVGLMWWDKDDFAVAQLLARHYGEEPAVLRHAAGWLGRKRTLVSFNGKSFDWPLLRERAAANLIRLPEPAGHRDLLHEARRAWPELPDHRLSTLETVICRRRRTGDIAGFDIPQVYHDFVRSGDARLIGDVLRHNLWDLLTMGDLSLLLLAGGSSTPQVGDSTDPSS